jgi:signal transduction histidine kinase
VLVLRDDTGLEFINIDLKGRALEVGSMVAFEGKQCVLRPRNFGLSVTPGLAVNNDGVHPVKIESATVSLHAGTNPFRVQWFNGPGDVALGIEYEGPDLPRQRIPNSALLRASLDGTTGQTNLVPGLEYRCYEGSWMSLPDFARISPVKSGVATNFDLGVRTRNEAVGLEFSGFLKVLREGVYAFYLGSDDGARLWIGDPCLEVRALNPQERTGTPGRPRVAGQDPKGRPWVTMEGAVDFVGLRGTGGELQMRVANDDIRVDVFESGDSLPNLAPRTRVKVSGNYAPVVNEDGSSSPGVLRVGSWNSIQPVASAESLLTKPTSVRATTIQPTPESAATTNETPVGVTVAEIKTLAPELAKQEIPVSIRGVVTTVLPENYGAVLQDSTRGIFVYLQDPEKMKYLVQRGEYYQIDGVTGPGLFAPVIVPRRVTHLGPGQWPEPVRATWAQLVNGSLDTQYVEIDGVVTAVQAQGLSLLTEGGKITLNLSGFRPETLAAYANAVVRIRGCIFAPFNGQTHQLQSGTLLVGDAAVSVLQQPPRDPFDAPQRSIGELLLYDPEAAPFRRLKVTGQVIHVRHQVGEYFLAEGTNGVRVTTRKPESFAVGDLADVVGFLGLGGPAAELKEAVMRKKGCAPLPAPTKVNADELLLARYAGTLVEIEATLMNQWREGSVQVLELQSRFLAFRARLENRTSPLPSSGSRLALCGVYVPLGNRAVDGTVGGFELLLQSPASIRLLARPPWWTLKRVLFLSGILAALLCAVLIWNKSLHRQVQERSRQLETEISHRERAEQQRTAETERARIARDLHDELGAGLTEVSLLASAGLGDIPGPDKSHNRFHVIADKARSLVSALDVIVWAIDPKRNSLQSFADYLGSYAEELLSTSSIVCRLRIPIECEAVALPGAARHSLFLASKEALNNVIRHACATEVELKMTQFDHHLEIVIADNGRGFEWNALRRQNGLLNLQERLGALDGQCQIESQPGSGTTVRFTVPLRNGAGRSAPAGNFTS